MTKPPPAALVARMLEDAPVVVLRRDGTYTTDVITPTPAPGRYRLIAHEDAELALSRLAKIPRTPRAK